MQHWVQLGDSRLFQGTNNLLWLLSQSQSPVLMRVWRPNVFVFVMVQDGLLQASLHKPMSGEVRPVSLCPRNLQRFSELFLHLGLLTYHEAVPYVTSNKKIP